MPGLIDLARRTTSVSREWATVADETLALPAPPAFSTARQSVVVTPGSPQSPGDLMKWLAAMKPDQVVVSLDEVVSLAHAIAAQSGTREGAVVS
jgi:hypothetical protein